MGGGECSRLISGRGRLRSSKLQLVAGLVHYTSTVEHLPAPPSQPSRAT